MIRISAGRFDLAYLYFTRVCCKYRFKRAHLYSDKSFPLMFAFNWQSGLWLVLATAG